MSHNEPRFIDQHFPEEDDLQSIVQDLGQSKVPMAASPLDPSRAGLPLVRSVEGPLSNLVKTTRRERIRDWIDYQARTSPARLTIFVFTGIVVATTLLLSLPISSTADRRAALVDVFFTAVSAVCVTGLTTVDSATYWSGFGQAVIAFAITIGGLGVMTLASILGLAVSRHLGLTQRMLAAQETKSSALGSVGTLLRAVVGTSIIATFFLFVAFLPTFWKEDDSFHEATLHSLFMAISVFNNAGFVILPGGLEPHVNNAPLLFFITMGTFIGAIGFPVVTDIAGRWRTPRRWTLHTKLTLSTYLFLALAGSVFLAIIEWNNPQTLGSLPVSGKVSNILLAGFNSRSSGISPLNIGSMYSQTHFIQDILMIIGGGSASTAGGVKVTTFAVLVLAAVAETRGDRDIEAYGRRIPTNVVRLAVTVCILSFMMVAIAVTILLCLTDYSLDAILFESISAFATVGLSTGLTATLPPLGKIVLALLMFLGRTGPMTVAAALALRQNQRIIRLPVERPIVG